MFGSQDDKPSPEQSGEKKSLFGWLRKKPQEDAPASAVPPEASSATPAEDATQTPVETPAPAKAAKKATKTAAKKDGAATFR